MGRMFGQVTKVARDHMSIGAQNGLNYYAHLKDSKAPGSHFCVFLNHEVTFIPKVYPGMRKALDVVIEDADVSQVQLSETEESVITAWHGTFGFAERLDPDCHCEIFVPGFGSRTPAVGDRITHQLVVSDGRWCAWNAVILGENAEETRREVRKQTRRDEFMPDIRLEKVWRHGGKR